MAAVNTAVKKAVAGGNGRAMRRWGNRLAIHEAPTMEEAEGVVKVTKLTPQGLVARCWLCHEPCDLSQADPDRSPSWDHYVPRCWGGRNDIGNARLAHARCNSERARRYPESLLFTASEIYRLAHLTDRGRLGLRATRLCIALRLPFRDFAAYLDLDIYARAMREPEERPIVLPPGVSPYRLPRSVLQWRVVRRRQWRVVAAIVTGQRHAADAAQSKTRWHPSACRVTSWRSAYALLGQEG